MGAKKCLPRSIRKALGSQGPGSAKRPPPSALPEDRAARLVRECCAYKDICLANRICSSEQWFVYQRVPLVRVPLRGSAPGQVAGEVDAEDGANADMREVAAGAEAVDGFAVDGQECGSLARRDEFPRKSLQH
jgi:hypothetical protein